MPIFTHVFLGASDVEASRKFYDATLAPLGIKNLVAFPEGRGYAYGVERGELMVGKPRNGEEATAANGGTIGLSAATRNAVREFHAAALANGGTCDGEPGPRPAVPNSFGCYVRDPVGNKLCAFTFAPEAE